MLSTYYEIRNHCRETARETDDLNSLIEEYINLTIDEIQNPSWAFQETRLRDYHHLWRANRRKYTLSTVTNQEFYQLPRDVVKIHLVRQTDTPVKLTFVPDELFYKWIPNPTATGNPRYYRLWEEYGVSTQLTANDTIDIVSNSTSDTTQKVIIRGKDANSLDVTEELTLNGTTAVNGSVTFSEILQISKNGITAGTITISDNSATTGTLALLAPEERTARFLRIGFYVIASSAISIYIEYYTRFRNLVNGGDVPDFDERWHWVVREGTLAKIYQYQNKEQSFAVTQNHYAHGVRSMVMADIMNVDYVPYLKDTQITKKVGIIETADDTYAPIF